LMRRFHQEPTVAYDVNKAIKQALTQIEFPNNIVLIKKISQKITPG